jgi:hypothetical protein
LRSCRAPAGVLGDGGEGGGGGATGFDDFFEQPLAASSKARHEPTTRSRVASDVRRVMMSSIGTIRMRQPTPGAQGARSRAGAAPGAL